MGDSDVQNITGAKTFTDSAFKERNPAGTFSLTHRTPAITADKSTWPYLPYSFVIEKIGAGTSSYYAKQGTTSAVEYGPDTAQNVIQAAIDDLAAGLGTDTNRQKGMIFIRNNEFVGSSGSPLSLTLKSGIWLVGEGDGTVCQGKITVQDQSDGAGMKNIQLYNSAADHCLYINGAYFFHAENCQFYLDNTTLTKYPVLIDGGTTYSTSAIFDKCKIVSKGNGLKQQASATTKYSNTTTIRDSFIVFVGTPLPATGGQIGLDFDGDAVEKNLFVENCYIESWDTPISLDNGWAYLNNVWLDTCTTQGIIVTQAAINAGSQYINVGTSNITTSPLLVLGGRKYYATSANYSMVYDNRKIQPNTAWVEKYLLPAHNPAQPYGAFYGHNSGAAGEGLFAQVAISGTALNSGDYANGRWVRYKSDGASGDNCGFRYTGFPFTYRGWNPSFFMKMRVDNLTASRGWFGWATDNSEPTGDDMYNSLGFFGLGWKAGDTNWQVITNDSSGATSYASTGVAIAANTIYTLELRAEDTTPRFGYSIDGATMAFVLSNIPGQQNPLYPMFQVEATSAAQRQLDRFLVFHRGDK